MVVTMESLLGLTNQLRGESRPDVPPRDADGLLAEFLNDQENPFELSELAVSRLLLLNKRRKSHEGRAAMVFADGESSLTHLEDCFEIIKLVDPKIRTSALIHDIGKTGPKNIDQKTCEIVMALFAEIHDINIREGKVIDLLIKIFDEPKDLQVAVDLLRRANIDVDSTLNDFYQMHVDWGADLLKNEENVTDREKFIALNHHQMLRGKAVEINGFVPDKETERQAHELELADFYQAARTRGKKSPTQAQSLLRKIFVEKISLNELNAMIDKIAERENAL